jgi:hypothetical protein
VLVNVATTLLWRTESVKETLAEIVGWRCLIAGAVEVVDTAAYRRLRSRVVSLQQSKLRRSEKFWRCRNATQDRQLRKNKVVAATRFRRCEQRGFTNPGDTSAALQLQAARRSVDP